MIKKQIPKFQFSGHCFPILPSATIRCQCCNTFYKLFLWNKFIMYNSTSVKKPMSMLSAYEQTYLSCAHGRWWAPPLRCLLLGFWVIPIQLSHHLWSPYSRILGLKHLLKILACADTIHLCTSLSRKSTGLLAFDAHTDFHNAPNWHKWYFQQLQNFCFWGQVPSLDTSSLCFALRWTSRVFGILSRGWTAL